MGADHVAPLYVSTWFDASVAAQNVSEAHDTAVSGLTSIDAGAPQAPLRYATAWPLLLTAMQSAPLHETPLNEATPVAVGTLHDAPLHVLAVPASSTATQKLDDAHPTPVTLPGRASIVVGAPHVEVRTVAWPA